MGRLQAALRASKAHGGYLEWARKSSPTFEQDWKAFVRLAQAQVEATDSSAHRVDMAANSRRNVQKRRLLKQNPAVKAAIRRCIVRQQSAARAAGGRMHAPGSHRRASGAPRPHLTQRGAPPAGSGWWWTSPRTSRGACGATHSSR